MTLEEAVKKTILKNIYKQCMKYAVRITTQMNIEWSWDTSFAAYEAYQTCVKYFFDKRKDLPDAIVRYSVKKALFSGGVPQGYKKKDKIKLTEMTI